MYTVTITGLESAELAKKVVSVLDPSTLWEKVGDVLVTYPSDTVACKIARQNGESPVNCAEHTEHKITPEWCAGKKGPDGCSPGWCNPNATCFRPA